MLVDPENPGPAEPAAPPRAGVPGLLPRQVRDRMAEGGWAGIPIRAHDDGSKSAGKAPTILEWQRFAEFGAELPTAEDRRVWERREGPGTGIPCGSIVGIDIDVRDPALVAEIVRVAFEIFRETPFIRQGSAPKVLLVYQAAEPLPKRAFKANDGSGDGLDIMGAGSQFVAYGVHPRTCRPYEWLGGATPLTASPSAAPAITAAQVEAFLDRVRVLLPLSKTGGRARGPGGESAEIKRDAEGFVIDGRELHLARCVWRTAADLYAAGEALTEATVVARAWADFERTARVEVNGKRRTKDECADKVRGRLARIRQKLVKLPSRPVAVEATYPDDAMPLDEAEAAVARHVTEFFKRDAQAFKDAQTLYDIKHKTNPLALPPDPFGVALRIETGAGKTKEAIRVVAGALRGMSIVYAVPTVELGDDVARRFREEVGVDARVWRGREKPDPDAPPVTDPDTPAVMMCRDLQAVADARRAGAGVRSVAGAVCSAKPAGGPVRQCRHFGVCGHVRQKSAEPALWIVTHAMLFNMKPGAIPRADAIVIDESFYGNAIPSKPAVLAVDAIERAGLPGDYSSARTLQRARRALVEALRQAADGPLSRATLEAAGVTPEIAREAKKLEWGRFVEPAIVPGQAPKARAERADSVADVNREVKLLAGLWAEVAASLDGDVAASGRLTLAQDAKGARVIRRRSLKTLHRDWRCPTLILDATAPPAEVLSIVLGMPVDMRASIRARWHEIGRVRQVIGGPQSSNALGANGQGGGERSIAELSRYVAWRAALAFPAKVGVVIQKDLVERFEAHGLGQNVEVRHFGALAGLDHWREFGGVVLIGRMAPPPGAMEADAGVLTGMPVERTAEPFAAGGILSRDSSTIGVPVIRLADPVAESLRWQVCEGNLIQALGRIRPLRAHGRESFFVDVLCDVPLPIVVDEVKRWDEVRPEPYAAMASDGVILTSAGDAATAFKLSRKAARTLVDRATVALTSKEGFPLDVRATVRRPRWVRYKRQGRYPSNVEAFVLANGPRGTAAVLAWLEEHVGSIEALDIEHRKVSPETHARIWRDIMRPYAMKPLPGSITIRCPALDVAPRKLARLSPLICLPPSPLQSLVAKLQASSLQRLAVEWRAAEGDEDDLGEPTAA